jgi:methylated-DNA-[protein]-cysteine S-methyltransferase
MTISPALDRRFREAALEQGLLDVAYDIADTPVGPLLVAATDRGLARISYDPDADAAEDQLARVFGARLLRVPRAVDPVRRQLDEYFEGVRHNFDLTIDLRVASDFSRTVLEELVHVPYGRLTTYGALAAQAGRPRAARAVGTIMNRNPIPIVLPCHRVVGATGSLVGYAGGLERKQQLLALEGSLAD